MEVAWNGCGELWPDGGPAECWGQASNGYGDGIGLGKAGEEEEVGRLVKGVVGVGVPHRLGGGRDDGDVGSDVLHELGAALFELIHAADSTSVVGDKR